MAPWYQYSPSLASTALLGVSLEGLTRVCSQLIHVWVDNVEVQIGNTRNMEASAARALSLLVCYMAVVGCPDLAVLFCVRVCFALPCK